MATYTYDDFMREANASVLLNSFSSADLKLAQSNPDAGMSLLSAKRQYTNAATEAERLQANYTANEVRSSYGGYSGGNDGSEYLLNSLSPSSFTQETAPGYQNNYTQDIADLYAKQKDYGSYNYSNPAPTYDNRYGGQVDELLNAMLNRGEFNYDPMADELYSAYRKQFLREGDRAMQDAIGGAAAASGGIPSSYTATAAAQVRDHYAAGLTDKIPELYQIAYNKYLNDFGIDQSKLSAVQGVEQNDYAKYLNELMQHNTDRSFDYGVWQDGYNMTANNLQTAQGLEQNDYAKYLNELMQQNTNRAFDYGVLTDEISKQSADWERQYNLAQLAAAAGDLSGLQKLGIDTSNYPKAASYSGGGSGGSNASYTQGDVLSALYTYQNGKPTAKDYNVLLDAGYISFDDFLTGMGLAGTDAGSSAGMGSTGQYSNANAASDDEISRLAFEMSNYNNLEAAMSHIERLIINKKISEQQGKALLSYLGLKS